MEILEVTYKEYSNVINKPYHVFGSAEFNNLNAGNCESIHYLLFKESKFCLGLVAGIKNNTLYSPFSAPYGGFSFVNNGIRINHIDDALDLLLDWAKSYHYSGISITLPASIYHESFISKSTNSLFRKNFLQKKIDLNYSFLLANFNDSYIDDIWHNARRNLKISLIHPFDLQQCKTAEEKALAFEIIRQNREIRGFSLKLSLEQVMSTTKVVKVDFFVLRNENNIPVAASIIFHVTPEIVQIIYWGDLPEYNHLKTMNYLSYKTFEFYKKKGLKIIDIGPSTDNSIPNLGLCEFKESIGCGISTRMTFEYVFI